MKQAKYLLRCQSGGRGLAAGVTLDVSACEKPGLTITFPPSDDKDWNYFGRAYSCAVEFGIRYAFEKIRFSRDRGYVGLLVSIIKVDGLVVDSTQMAMAFAASMAFWDAVEIQPAELPVFDRSARKLSFLA